MPNDSKTLPLKAADAEGVAVIAIDTLVTGYDAAKRPISHGPGSTLTLPAEEAAALIASGAVRAA